MVTDLLLKDEISLPLIAQIRETHPKLPVVVLTMFATGEYRDAALAAGASGYVMKSQATGELISSPLCPLQGEHQTVPSRLVPIIQIPTQSERLNPRHHEGK